jgi:transcriptional regulator with XRE-family HTH domain
MTIGERVLVLRRRAGLSQVQLGKAAAIDSNTIARLERGVVHDLMGARIIRLARVLRVSTDVLLGVVAMDAQESPRVAAVAS